MSNKFLIPVIIILSLITIGVASLTQLNKAPEKVAMNTNQSSEVASSVISQVASSSSSVQSQSQVSSLSVVYSVQKVEESVSVESVESESQPTIPNTNNPKVTYLDSKNPPQYIKDYYTCQKLTRSRSGIFVFEENNIQYNCPPDSKCFDFNVLRYNYGTKKWICTGSFDESNLCPFYFVLQVESNPEHKAINDKIFTSGLVDSNKICLIITKTKFSEKEVKILQEKYNSVDFIIYNPNN